ncbi:glycosyl hydrolase family 3 N terminal domain-containing protein [Lipomyces doorenjongii]|uniref:glycosyl hydrolase family 3 N terminal domain-containing protein n=1 Tax=Lipomyces doorenjongii TaxID=383834 RepID=UPI0034CD08A1
MSSTWKNLVFVSLLVILNAVGAQIFSWDHSLFTGSPPVYPSPATAGIGWENAFAQADAFVANLTMEEKVTLLTGTTRGPCIGNIAPIARVGFDGLCLQDGPASIRQATYASLFPAGLTAAASWDKGLIYSRGLYMGAEFKAKGAHIALGPVAGPLGRSGYGGRGWEGFSPDPYLTGIAMEHTISAMQKSGVQATAKHFIGNEQETQRNPSTSQNNTTIEAVSSNIDDRTMHELYLWPFANAVRAGVASVMCSYNRVNSSYSCQNSKVLNGLLKEELGFQGYVMSDWGAVHAGFASAEAGLDMNMPGPIEFFGTELSFWGSNLTTSVNNGSLSEMRIDDMARRIMTPYFQLRQDIDYPPIDMESGNLNFLGVQPYLLPFKLGTANVDVRQGHAHLIRELAAAGTVLLKNTNNALPLRAPKTIGVFGNDAGNPTNGLYTLSSGDYEYGTLAIGGGSGTGRLSYVVTPLDALKFRASRDGSLVQFLLNNTLISDPALAFQSIAPSPDVCLVLLKTWATEGADRTTLLADWNSTAVVESVASYCNNTVVITHSGGPNTMPWAEHPNVTAIVAAHFPGQESGNSLVDILYGDVNPSGKLPYTIANEESDYAFADITNSTELQETEDPNAWQSDFKEGLLIDYRHFDYYNRSVLYEFGFGLSYTRFSMSNLIISNVYSNRNITARPPRSAITPGGNPTLYDVLYRATAVVTNTGSVAGATVPQLYLSLPQIPGEDPTPLKVLRGFEKVSLQPGQSTKVSFDLMRRDISYWDASQQEWIIASGVIEAQAGFSSRDIRLVESFSPL